MLNLIPPTARKMVITEYWVRAVTVIMFLLGTGCLIVASLFLPSYVLVANQLGNMEAEVAARAAEVASYDASAGALTAAMRQANTLLDTTGSTTPATKLGTTLVDLGGQEVTLFSLEYANVQGTTTIIISGQATNREALASYRDAIEAHPYFSSADLPISSLIKDRDLLFTMTIVATP